MLSSSDRTALRDCSLSEVHGDQHVTIVNNVHSLSDDKILDATLRPAGSGADDVHQCMEGTRKDEFQTLDSWLDDSTAPNILWISGSPGAGKSAIASSLVSSLSQRERLGSSFFFERGHTSFSDPSVVWRSVANNLAKFDPKIKGDLVDFLKGPGFRNADIVLHFKRLVMMPLVKNEQALSAKPPVVILDALDECGSDDSQLAQRRNFLKTLTYWPQLPRLFKLVITSRDEGLPHEFYNSTICHRILLETGSLASETNKDIRRFFETRFEEIRRDRGANLASTRDMLRLTQCAAGLFIWATTAMTFLEGECAKGNHHAAKIALKNILDSGGRSGVGTKNIDELYRQILSHRFQSCGDASRQLFKSVLGIIIVAKKPLRRDDLTHFLDLHEDEDAKDIDLILDRLSSLILRSRDGDGTIRLHHPSFLEFLSDDKRCTDTDFVINPAEQHRVLSLACLKLMKQGLKFNICDLDTSYLRNDEVQDLPSRIQESIPPYLEYSCCFWAEHLRDSQTTAVIDRELSDEVGNFLHNLLLYWLEVLSLIGEVSLASRALVTTARWIEVRLLYYVPSPSFQKLMFVPIGFRSQLVSICNRCQ